MTEIIGLDPSYSATGVAHVDGTVEVVKWRGDGVCRLLDAHDRITSGALFGPSRHVATVYIEGYAHGQARSAHKMGELGGVLRLALMHAGIPYIDVQPTTLKKYATGKGNASKDQVLAEAIRRLGYAGHSNDEADALWLREIGLAHVGDILAVPVPATHLQALEKLG